jgi:hypothetical protein
MLEVLLSRRRAVLLPGGRGRRRGQRWHKRLLLRRETVELRSQLFLRSTVWGWRSRHHAIQLGEDGWVAYGQWVLSSRHYGRLRWLCYDAIRNSGCLCWREGRNWVGWWFWVWSWFDGSRDLLGRLECTSTMNAVLVDTIGWRSIWYNLIACRGSSR